MPPKSTKIAFIAYETPYSPCGGIAAVMDFLPAQMAKQIADSSRHGNISEVVVISPLHFRSERLSRMAYNGQLELTCQFKISTAKGKIDLMLLSAAEASQSGLSWHFVMPKGNDPFKPPLFAGYPHPYKLHDDPGLNSELLLRDSLIFGQAAAKALYTLDHQASWRLLLQDWEAATTALALKGALEEIPLDYQAWLTLHNAYDCEALDPQLIEAGLDPASTRDIAVLNSPKAEAVDTVLRRTLAAVDPTVFTVSQQYARDLNDDIFQSQVLAPHLQDWLSYHPGQTPCLLKGVNNGCFQRLSIPSDLMDSLRQGDYLPIQSWKDEQRDLFLEALGAHNSGLDEPIWGDALEFSKTSSGLTWFAMGGRDDTRQKGYDLMTLATREFLLQGGQAGFLFFPIPGDEGLVGLSFLKRLAEEFPGQVIVMPFRFSSGFMAAMHGASFGVMPSLYEPFGGANEFYLRGALGLARATGGLVQQIIPAQDPENTNRQAHGLAHQWWPEAGQPTGLLFREPDPIESEGSDWQAINEAAYEPGFPANDRMAQRSWLPLVQAMSVELRSAFKYGCMLYQEQPETYYAMLLTGIDHLTTNFTWQATVDEYLSVISSIGPADGAE